MALPVEWFELNVKFKEPVLGSQPQKDVASEFIIEKAKAEHPELAGLDTSDEEATLEEHLERGTTVFHHLDGKPIFFNYQIRGFLKESARTFNGHMGVRNMRAKMASQVFVYPRRIILIPPPGREFDKNDYLERPLRCETLQGPRTALARSERLPEGTSFTCYLKAYKTEFTEALLRDLLSYGEDLGIGQWRSGGWGSFSFELKKLDGLLDEPIVGR